MRSAAEAYMDRLADRFTLACGGQVFVSDLDTGTALVGVLGKAASQQRNPPWCVVAPLTDVTRQTLDGFVAGARGLVAAQTRGRLGRLGDKFRGSTCMTVAVTGATTPETEAWAGSVQRTWSSVIFPVHVDVSASTITHPTKRHSLGPASAFLQAIEECFRPALKAGR